MAQAKPAIVGNANNVLEVAMSLPMTRLSCDRCGLVGSVSGVPTDAAYVVGGLEIPMVMNLGYCYDCSKIGFILESFEDGASTQHQLKKAYASGNSEQVSILEARLKLIHQRRGTECCVLCGGRAIVPLGQLPSLDDGMGRKPTQFEHPECGGMFWHEGSGLRIAFSRNRARYWRFSAEGTRINGLDDMIYLDEAT
jgi:hypothetical protein